MEYAGFRTELPSILAAQNARESHPDYAWRREIRSRYAFAAHNAWIHRILAIYETDISAICAFVSVDTVLLQLLEVYT